MKNYKDDEIEVLLTEIESGLYMGNMYNHHIATHEEEKSNISVIIYYDEKDNKIYRIETRAKTITEELNLDNYKTQKYIINFIKNNRLNINKVDLIKTDGGKELIKKLKLDKKVLKIKINKLLNDAK